MDTLFSLIEEHSLNRPDDGGYEDEHNSVFVRNISDNRASI